MTDDPRSIVRRQPLPHSVSTPVVTPIYPSVVYRSPDADALDAQYDGQTDGYTYAREGHPNATVLGAKIDWLEGLDPPGIVTASGMAALSAMFLGLLSAGDHVVAGDQLYGRTLRLLTRDLPRLGITASMADATRAERIEAALTPRTRLILIETVSNPTLRLADLDAIARLARARGVLLAVDNTFTTPRTVQPFARGADLVIHSVTKLLAGHSDVTLGWIGARDPGHRQALYDTVVTWGLTPSPFDCWLAERGLHSFALRHDRAQSTAARLAEALASQPDVEAVLYPGRPDHPDHALTDALLGGHGGTMVSFRLGGGREAVNRLLRAAAHIPFAPTLGDIGTTLSHPASSSHRGLTAEAREALGIPEGFLRVSVGCEDADQLIGEILSAISTATA